MAMRDCFVIAPIGDDGSPTRKWSDQVLKFVITPALNKCDYTPIRADTMPTPGLITSQVIKRVVEDPLVVADLTGQNANVFYELAIRHASRKPLVQLIKKGQVLPFDVATMRTIDIDLQDPDSIEKATEELVAQVKELDEVERIDTPISSTLDLLLLAKSADEDQRTLADVLTELASVSATVRRIEKRLPNPLLEAMKNAMLGAADRHWRVQVPPVDTGSLSEQIEALTVTAIKQQSSADDPDDEPSG